MNIGIFHWSFDEIGGGEVLAKHLGDVTGSPVYSIVKDPSNNPFNFIDISDDLPFSVKQIRKIRSFDYLTWSNIDITKYGDFDIVITSGTTARALIVPDNVMHIHYNHSTARWLYDLWHHRKQSKGRLMQNVLPFVSEAFRIWDYSVDSRVDYYLTNSEITQRRLKKYLKRESDVLYPPIDHSKYYNNEPEEYYLFIGRLYPEKRPIEAIEACINAKKIIVVIGSGILEKTIKERYLNHPLIDIRSNVSEEYKLYLLSKCEGVIYPCMHEDFGIVPIEALAAGKPVITVNEGFPPILLNKSGNMSDCKSDIGVIAESIDKLSDAIIECSNREWYPVYLNHFAKQFDVSKFKERLYELLNKYQKE